ncbi:MAG: hypothetical protein AAGB35_07430 [Pseudomonadota bacterium]
MFSFKFNRCKNTLQKGISKCFDPLKDELGTVPTELQSSKFVTGSMLGICTAYAIKNEIVEDKKIAWIADAVFEEIFRRDATMVLTKTDHWRDCNDEEFMDAYENAKDLIQNDQTLDLTLLQKYLTDNYDPSTTLML